MELSYADAIDTLNLLDAVCNNIFNSYTVNDAAAEIIDEYLEECLIARSYLDGEGVVESDLLCMMIDNPNSTLMEYHFYGLACGEVIIRFEKEKPEELIISVEDSAGHLVHGTIINKNKLKIQ